MISYRIVLASVLLLCGGLLSGQTVSFLTPVAPSYTAGTYLGASVYIDFCRLCIRTADFNGDGNMDIVYSGMTEEAPRAGVLLGNGDGTFRLSTRLENSFGHITSILVADFDGDGKPDIAFCAGGCGAFYLGQGDGTFALPVGLNGGQWWDASACAAFPVVADVNGDGKPDLVCGASVLLNNGNFVFSAAPTALAGAAVLAADFNGDGHIDLLLVDASGQLAVALGKGDGTFGPSLPVSGLLLSGALNPTETEGYPYQPIQAGDFNGDGVIDLAGPSADGTSIIVLPGRGDGTFAPAIVTANVPDGLPTHISAAADFNHDGKLDLVAIDATVDLVAVLAGNGDGTFQYPVLVGTVGSPCDAVTESGQSGCGTLLQVVAVADFNNDGLPDLASGSGDDLAPFWMSPTEGDVSVVLNDSPGNGFTVTGVSAATWTWPVGSGSMVSAFGVNLAPTEAAAGAGPWPTTLGGIRLHVKDRSGVDVLAPLLYVSPTQINYVLQSPGPFAWIGIERVGEPFVAQGMAVPVNSIVPGLFTLDGGLAAASAVRVAPDGTQTFVSALVPIDLSGDPVYLSLYGTGFDLATTMASSCAIAGQTLPATYAGPQMQTVGLDQINVLLPKTLAGTGETSVTCSFGLWSPIASNAVKLTVR